MRTNSSDTASAITFHPYTFTQLHFSPKENDELRWICSECRAANNIAMPKCRRCIDGVKIDPPMLRVFFGQLPKDRTVMILDWLVHLLCPTVAVFHIESHTAKGGRGKGCAWVYVRAGVDAEKLVGMNHRALLAPLEDGKHGAFLGEPSALSELSAAETDPMTNPDLHLLVVELPMTAAEKIKRVSAAKEEKEAALTIATPRVAASWRHDPYGFCPIPAPFRLSMLDRTSITHCSGCQSA